MRSRVRTPTVPFFFALLLAQRGHGVVPSCAPRGSRPPCARRPPSTDTSLRSSPRRPRGESCVHDDFGARSVASQPQKRVALRCLTPVAARFPRHSRAACGHDSSTLRGRRQPTNRHAAAPRGRRRPAGGGDDGAAPEAQACPEAVSEDGARRGQLFVRALPAAAQRRVPRTRSTTPSGRRRPTRTTPTSSRRAPPPPSARAPRRSSRASPPAPAPRATRLHFTTKGSF